MQENRNACRDFMGNTEGKRHLGTPGVVGRMILKWNLKDMGWINVDWIDVTGDWDKWRAVMHTRYGNERSSSMIWGNFLTAGGIDC
jgi:hypothetical protein